MELQIVKNTDNKLVGRQELELQIIHTASATPKRMDVRKEVAKQMKAFHDQCGTGVVDLFFQQPSVGHGGIMKEIELFGREVLPRIKEF